MSRVKTWLLSDKKFYRYFRAFTRHLPGHCRDCLFSSEFTTTNYSSYLSYLFFQNKFTKSVKIYAPFKSPASPRVPPTSGTFSFGGSKQKILWFFEIEKVPARHRSGLVKLLQKHRSCIFLCSVFKPDCFSSSLAEMSDFYFIKKRSWLPIAKQAENIFSRLLIRQAVVPDFSPKYTFKEKLVMRILFRLRRRVISLEEISSYVYGRRLNKNLHATEVAIAGLRRKLSKITGRETTISNIRNCGYRIGKEVWENILADGQLPKNKDKR